ncbi:acyltransferase family protein [Cohnella faecalis]|nr:acyltransferase family protein [Cohnella faecalis]
MKERYEQLDALRGLAALTVLFSHLAMTPANVPPLVHQFLYRAYSPFSILIKGHQAVFFFFVLSGFVLSLPLLRGSKLNYTAISSVGFAEFTSLIF